MRACLVALVAASVGLAADTVPARVELLDGRTLEGAAAIPEDGDVLVLETGGRTVRLKTADVLSLEFGSAPPHRPPDPGAVLRNGDEITGRVGATSGDTLTVQTALLGTVVLPLDQVAGLRLVTPAGDVLPPHDPPGALLADGSFVAGPIRWITAAAVAIDSTVLGLMEVPRERVSACLVARPAAAASAEPHAEVRLRAGDVLSVALRRLDATEAVLEAPWLERRTIPVTALERVRFLGGRVRRLTDLAPADIKTVPYFDAVRSPRRGLSLGGRPLRIGSRRYVTGWGVESRTELTFRLDGRYVFFRSDVGLDEEVGPGGSVEFMVELDGTIAWRSGLVTGGMEPKRVHCRVAGAKVMRLIADFGDAAHVLDHADWGDPVLVAAP